MLSSNSNMDEECSDQNIEIAINSVQGTFSGIKIKRSEQHNCVRVRQIINIIPEKLSNQY